MAADGNRQAVVVIHGVGEQQPMETLRSFVGALLGAAPRPSFWQRITRRQRHPQQEEEGPARFHSKPDRLTDTLELRRLNWRPTQSDGPASAEAKETDFYELYWAHLMRGTVWSHIVAWLGVLMFRFPRGAHPRVKCFWVACWLACGAVAYLAFRYGVKFSVNELLGYGALGVLAYVALRALDGLGLRYVGDAARYLSPTPDNIETRKNTRNAVIQALDKLHEDDRYGRIVVVGHSLGSVIAYDALTHLWQQRHSRLSHTSPFLQPKLDAALAAGNALTEKAAATDATREAVRASLDDYRVAQHELLSEQQEIGISWRISDLVTLGSPLTHACFLLANDTYEWQDLLRERVYPTSPPQLADARDEGRLVRHFAYADSKHFAIKILHHAALFACTRWTNLYFPGDPIGGQLAGWDRFGYGIKDVELSPVRWQSHLWLAHTRYWNCHETTALVELRAALDLADSVRPASMVPRAIEPRRDGEADQELAEA